jgi:hypothetical protein
LEKQVKHMSVFRSAIQFFKTWFLPVRAHDDEQETSMFGRANANTTQPVTAPESPDTKPPTPPESTAQASYAIPPFPVADAETETAEPAQVSETTTADSPRLASAADNSKPDFSHMVKAPDAADMRHSRRRMEGSDPTAFE